MAKYRKRPIAVDAVQMPSANGDFTAMPPWLNEAIENDNVAYSADGCVLVETLVGVESGVPGDWVVKDEKGDLHLVQNSTFKATYEQV